MNLNTNEKGFLNWHVKRPYANSHIYFSYKRHHKILALDNKCVSMRRALNAPKEVLKSSRRVVTYQLKAKHWKNYINNSNVKN